MMKSEISNMEEGDRVYSNLDHEYELTSDEVKESKQYHNHSAWDFCGYVYYDDKLSTFVEEVWVYKEVVDIHYNKELDSLIDGVISEYGSR